MVKFYKYLFITLLCSFFLSCQQEAGYGGNATIHGRVKIHHYNSDYSILKDSSFASDENVYIIFGNNASNGDDLNTNYDGSFTFSGLKPGNYTVFAYSEDPNQSSGFAPVMKSIQITKDNEQIDLGEIIIKDNNATGHSKIRGRVVADDGNNRYFAPDERVYIIYDNGFTYFTSLRTNYDGSFEFNELPKGTYTIYAYSNDNSVPSGQTIVSRNVLIDSSYQTILVPDLIINK